MGTLYLHLGLAKTATTALQNQFFPKLSGINYLHRETNDNKNLFYKIATYCFSKDEDLVLFDLVKRELEELLTKTDVLISEEWFTTDYSWFYNFKGAQWQEKLYRLGMLTSKIDCKILITTREPISGLFSLYCELYNVDVHVRYPSFLSFVDKSNDALSYDLVSLNNVMDKAFNQKPYLLPYEMLNAGNEFLLTIVSWLDQDEDAEFEELKFENKTERFGLNVISYSRSYTQKIIGRCIQLIPVSWRKRLKKTHATF